MKKVIIILTVFLMLSGMGYADSTAQETAKKPEVKKPVTYKLLTSQADSIRKLVQNFQIALNSMVILYESELREVGRIPEGVEVQFDMRIMAFRVKPKPAKKTDKK